MKKFHKTKFKKNFQKIRNFKTKENKEQQNYNDLSNFIKSLKNSDCFSSEEIQTIIIEKIKEEEETKRLLLRMNLQKSKTLSKIHFLLLKINELFSKIDIISNLYSYRNFRKSLYSLYYYSRLTENYHFEADNFPFEKKD